jgi:hypothetical protein
MELLLGGLAFACLMGAQFFAVVAVHDRRWETTFDGRRDRSNDARVRNIWLFGS